MRARPPSFGFLYLVAAIAAFAGFFVYLTYPMWWELSHERDRDLAEAAYLERIATDGPQAKRGPWLSSALDLAARHHDWEACDRMVATALRQQLALDDTVMMEIEPGTCWAVGLKSDRWTRGTNSIALFLRNDDDAARVMRMFWSAKRDGDGLVRRPGGEWQSFATRHAAESFVEHTVPPRSLIRLEIAADRGMFEGRGKNDRGIRLMRVEVAL